MTDEHLTADGGDVLTLQQLVRARMDERGWSYGELERRSGYRLSKGRWQQIATGVRQTNFPIPSNVQIMADVLEVDITTVILAAAQTLGLDARRRGPDLAQLLPAGTDRLSERMRDAILTIIRAAVAESLTADPDGDVGDSEDASMRWRKPSNSVRGNARAGLSDESV